MRQPLRGFVLLITWCAAVLVSGCGTLITPLAPGLEMEAAGQYPEAAEVYLGLLEEDPYLESARERLRKIGPLAVEELRQRASEAREEGSYVAAMRLVREVEELRRAAGAAGVVLPLPEGLTSIREEAAREAVAHLVLEAERAEEEGSWSEAEVLYQRALRYAPGEQQPELQDAMLELQLRRAGAELADGHFADAYDRVQRVLEELEENDPRREDAARLSRVALDAAAHYVVLMPIGVSDRLAGHLPEGLRVKLQEAFEEHFWEGAPRLIRSISRDARRRELRRLHYDRNRTQLRQAMEFGRVLGADLVVLTEVADFLMQEAEGEPEQRSDQVQANTSTDSDTAEQVILEMEAEVAYRIVDPSFGLVLNDGTVHASIRQHVERPVFTAATHNPILTEERQERFDLDAIAGQEHRAMQDLIDTLVEELSQRLYRDTLPGHQRPPDLSGN